MAYKFEIYKDKAGEFRFRFKASNGETMFGSEGYKSKASAVGAIRRGAGPPSIGCGIVAMHPKNDHLRCPVAGQTGFPRNLTLLT